MFSKQYAQRKIKKLWCKIQKSIEKKEFFHTLVKIDLFE